MRAPIGLIAGLAFLPSCASDPRGTGTECDPGAISCEGNVVQDCIGGVLEDGENCSASDLLCVPEFGCRLCVPERTFCCDELNQATYNMCTPDLDIVKCDTKGMAGATEQSCSTDLAEVCVNGSQGAICENACGVAARNRSYVGCEYYAVDMDNYAGDEGNAANQQFAFVLSNPSRLRAEVTVEINTAPPGDPPVPQVLRTLFVDPEDLEAVDDLAPREVDGSPEGTFNEGTGTALTSNAFRIRSTAPIIAYQFNPYQRYDVFSNDASLLVPTTAAGVPAGEGGAAMGSSYTVIGWPQLIAITEDPETSATVDLPALLTIVGTEEDTLVTVQTTAKIIGSPDVPQTAAGGILQLVLGPFDVLNLESDGFGEDFSGSVVSSDKPVLVFSGNECADVPDYSNLFTRQCCCDHMEEQLFPLQTYGKAFVAVQSPLRTVALADAGSDITPLPREKEYWRLLTTAEDTTCATTLPEPLNDIMLQAGSPYQIEATEDFLIECSDPVVAAQFVASQEVVTSNLTEPAGDPAFIVLPPVEQYRKEYLFLVPANYAFDYLLIAAPSGANVWLDDVLVEQWPKCVRTYVGQLALDQPQDFDSIKCGLSDPEVRPDVLPPNNVIAGEETQNDGIHRLRSDEPVGLVVYGFDRFVSYGYPGGSDLTIINVQ